MKNTTQQPLNGNGLVQLIIVGYSIRHAWVKAVESVDVNYFFHMTSRLGVKSRNALKSINHYRDHTCFFMHDRPSVQHHPRDPANVNAMKQTCVIVILA